MSALAVSLTMAQIAAAGALHRELLSWATTDRALQLLGERCAGFGPEATLLKVVAVNQLYGTNVYAVGRMAAHVAGELARQPPGATMDAEADAALVERLAALPPRQPNHTPRRYTSFASKFAHFFIGRERFPIYDEYAKVMVRHHLGRGYAPDEGQPYWAFVRNVHALRERAGLHCGLVELDRYLWLAGLYRAWRKQPGGPLNVEVARLFAAATLETAARLAMLLPA